MSEFDQEEQEILEAVEAGNVGRVGTPNCTPQIIRNCSRLASRQLHDSPLGATNE